MKLNTRRMTIDEYNRICQLVGDDFKEKYLITVEYDQLMEMIGVINDRLMTIMPISNHKGLVFRVSTEIGAMKPSERHRAIWVTLTRGSKDWFITNVELSHPSTLSIHPVNLCSDASPTTEKRLWSIIEHVTRPEWFNH